jgi:voltage-gated potassium channel
LIAAYFTVTTMTTVGYGDLSATNNEEMIWSCFVMYGGVIIFGYASGVLTAILTETDAEKEQLQNRLELLDRLDEEN